MPADLEVSDPFPIEYELVRQSKQIHAGHGRAFWEVPEHSGFQKKRGCYVFALKAGRGYTPWYVGKATKGFKQEIFTDHKLNHYNRVVIGRKGAPVMFFVAPPGTKNVIDAKHIGPIEQELIQYAYLKNPELRNTQHARVPEWSIRGVVRGGRGRPSAKASTFRTMMGM